jgi:hypothetical protein
MNKTAIKNYAIWARNKLIADISYKAGLLGITEKGIKSPLPQSTQTVQFFDIGTKEPSSITGTEIQQRKKLVEEIERKAKQSDYSSAFKNVIDEVAYTWFNRLIAIRFMEVNDYLPTRIRVLSSESKGKAEPDLVTHALEANLDYSAYEKDRIIQLKHENKLDELFRMLFIKQCNALNINLPELFEKTSDFTELLLNVSFTDKEGMVYHLVNDISEDDFNVSKEGQVEIIGWLYQYYNEERKNEVINIYKGTIKKDDIPAATQLFTTDWVVRYMVDNSLGRYWLERNPDSKLAGKLQYLAKPKNGEIKTVNEKIVAQEMTVFDPCMGSGHILVYAFDVLMEIYKESGYTERDAAQLIVQNNLFGLDIDNRAYQLAYFAVMMKARSYDRRFLTRGIEPNVSAILETNEISKFTIDCITNDKNQNKVGEYLTQIYKDAKEIGSLISVEKHDYEAFIEYLNNCSMRGQLSIESANWVRITEPLMKKIAFQASIMSKNFAVVCTNPPYMNKLEGQLKKFVIENYKAYSGDLFSVFMYRNFNYCKKDGYTAFMTPLVWMFIKTYENLREFIVNNKSIVSLIQMEYSAFEEATVPICSFILRNNHNKTLGVYYRLTNFVGGMEVQKNKVLEALGKSDCDYHYEANQDNFKIIKGTPIAYWLNKSALDAFNHRPLEGIAKPRQGMATSDNNRFLRLWYEVDKGKTYLHATSPLEAIESGCKWFPYNKGGSFRKWYGNNDYLINWGNDGAEVKALAAKLYKNVTRTIKNMQFYFQKGVTWTTLSSGSFSARYCDEGFLFDTKGSTCFFNNDDYILYCTAFLNSKVVNSLLQVLAPTLDYNAGSIAKLPFAFEEKYKDIVDSITINQIEISKRDWDSFETSWDFKRHPLLPSNTVDNDSSSTSSFYISNLYENFRLEVNHNFKTMKSNEEEINRIFIKIYGLQDNLTPELHKNEISIHFIPEDGETKSAKGNSFALTKQDTIKSLISYAVGCMFGRFSPDVDGVLYTGGVWDNTNNKTYFSDMDNILPITDEEYFEDDVVGMFVEFIKKIFGQETLEHNLNFIANALGKNDKSSREIIRDYFLNDFFKDHCSNYSVTGSGKRPIYWLFDSGKQNGFKALIYMHRYDENTIGNLRIDYLHRMQRIYENEIARMQDTIENSKDAREVASATKRKEKLIKQLQESKEYDEKIAHLALARTSIDLDDGVKVNYEKVQTDRSGKKLDVLAKI